MTDRRQPADNGFTIVELMIVVALIALGAGLVTLAWPDRRAALQAEATRFAARALAAHDLAMVEGRPVSLWVSRGGYGFDQHEAAGWRPMAARPFRVVRWQEDARPVLPGDGRTRVIFDATGLADVPLDLDLARGAAHVHVRIGNDGAVRVDG